MFGAIWPLLNHWGVFELENLDPSAELRREELRRFLIGLYAQASRFEAWRARSAEATPKYATEVPRGRSNG
jgi:acyl-[acyl-carrier-protein] desaturase